MDKAKLVRDEAFGESHAPTGWLGSSKPLMTAEEFSFLVPHLIPSDAIEKTENFLRHAGAQDCEGAVLWIAEREDESFKVRRVVVPRQSASRWHFDVPLEERIRIAKDLGQKEVVLLQIHSHPEEAFHSPTDDRKAIVDRQWALSIVVPNFCCEGLRDLNKLSAYALRGPLDWVQLSSGQLQRLFIIQ